MTLGWRWGLGQAKYSPGLRSNQEIRLEAGLETSYLQCRFKVHAGDGARDRAGDELRVTLI